MLNWLGHSRKQLEVEKCNVITGCQRDLRNFLNEFYEITYTILFNLLLYTFKKLVQAPLGREDVSLGLLP